jgi:peptidoglycan biosynthesis protein MviN/MurJ (putative lipid II flippase)
LALATSASAVVNAGLLFVWLKQQVGRLDGTRILVSTLKMLPGCVALGAVCWWGSAHLAARLGTTRELAKLLTVMVPLGLGGLAFVVCCAVLRTEELSSAWRLVFRRGR